MNMERNENGLSRNSIGRMGVNGTQNRMCPGRAAGGNGNTRERENSACPGTGDMWQPNTEISPELLEAHKSCSKHQLGMVYSPYQCWRMLYSVEDALDHGTLFEELYKPLEER